MSKVKAPAQIPDVMKGVMCPAKFSKVGFGIPTVETREGLTKVSVDTSGLGVFGIVDVGAL